MKRSKAYQNASEKIDRARLYSPAEAMELAKTTQVTKFDPTVEVNLRLGVDPRKQDQMVRGTVNLPNGTGKTARVLVFRAVTEIKGGKIEFRTDRHGNLHFVVGKASFEKNALLENYAAALDEVIRLKPAAAKGRYLKKVTFTTTMGPGIPVDPNKTRGFIEEAEAVA
jgi:large subunit ribosomal protein L1